MSLEVYSIPDQLVEAVVAIPEHEFGVGEHAKAIGSLLLMDFESLGMRYDEPLVLRLDSNAVDVFEKSFLRQTPLSVAEPAVQSVDRFDLLQIAVATSIGQPISIPHIRKGAIVQDIFPTDDGRLVPSSSYGSEATFAFHNDLSFLDDPEIPDYFTLGCIRNTEGVTTSVASVGQILDGLSAAEISELQKPAYAIKHTYNRGLPNEYEGTRNTAVILPNNEVRLGVDMTPQTSDASSALASLHGLLEEIAIPHQLQPGEIMVVPNRFAVHARDSFVPSTNPAHRRWLQRINVMQR